MFWKILLSVAVIYILIGAGLLGRIVCLMLTKTQKLEKIPFAVGAFYLILWPVVIYWEIKDLNPMIKKSLKEARDKIYKEKGIAP